MKIKSLLHLIGLGAALLATIAGAQAQAAALITNVVETGGDNEPTDTVTAKWTGVTFINGVADEPVPGRAAGDPYTVGVFGNHAPAFVDRNHRYTNAAGTVPIPAYLLDAEYIMIGLDNRDNAGLRLDVSVSGPARAHLLIDNRTGDGNNADPPTFGPASMPWVLDDGWTPVISGANRAGNATFPDEVGLDGNADGSIDAWYSVYAQVFPAGTFQLKQAAGVGLQMYGVVVVPASQPPVITQQPQSQTVSVGSNAVFNVTATGTPPLHYQWRFNGLDLAGRTNSILTILNVQPANAGIYVVQVSNPAASINSSNATLNVILGEGCCTNEAWIKVAELGPVARWSHATAYDSGHDRLVLFGGSSGSSTLDDTWLWNGTLWIHANPVTSPSARAGHAMAYDPNRGRVVLFGGASSTQLADTWEWDGTTWTNVTPSGINISPSARQGHAMAFDSVGGKVLLHGGFFPYKNDTWEWNGTTWTDVTPATTKPSARQLHGMAFDCGSGKVILHGGQGSGGSLLGDTWKWDGTAKTWTDVTPAITPGARYALTLATDCACRRVVLYGGVKATGYDNATWEWDGVGETWGLMTPSTAPDPRGWPATAYDTLRRQVLLFGGNNAGSFRGDTWIWTADCNRNGFCDREDILLGRSADCNGNWIPDECDPDCNHNGIPDDCECLPSQLKSVQGIGDPGPSRTPAWKRHVYADRAWFTRDGDWGGKGEVTLKWDNYPTARPPSVGYRLYPENNVGVIPNKKIRHTPKNHRYCSPHSGKLGRVKEYRWADYHQLVFKDEGADATVPMPDVTLNFEFREHDFPVLRLIEDYYVGSHLFSLCVAGLIPNQFVFDCPGLKAYEDDVTDIFAGKFTTSRYIGTHSHNQAGLPQTDCICLDYPPVTHACAEYNLDQTIHSQKAQLQLLYYGFTGGPGNYGQDFPGLAELASQPEDDLIRYEFAQKNGKELWCRAYVRNTAHLLDPFGNTDTRTLRFFYDINSDKTTGCPLPPCCGAEYEARVTLRDFNPGTGPAIGFETQIYAWCESLGAWLPTGTRPHRTEPVSDLVHVVVGMDDLGICVVGRNIASWVALERNGTVTVTDSVPEDPCGTRLNIPIVPDTECPEVESLFPEFAADGSLNALTVIFSEPMAPIAPSDVSLSLPGPTPIAISLQLDFTGKTLRITPVSAAVFPPGKLTLRILGTVTDLSGNQLDGVPGDPCGDDYVREYCSPERRLLTMTAAGVVTNQFASSDFVHVSGSAFPAGTPVRVYVVAPDSISAPGDVLIDLTEDGFNSVTTTIGGNLPLSNVGRATADGEYWIVADVNHNGHYDPLIDRVYDPCDLGFRVGNPCEDPIEDIVLYWPFDEGVSVGVSTELIEGHHAFHVGNPAPVAGIFHNALTFDGNDLLTVADNADLSLGTDDFTIELWIQTTAAGIVPLIDKRSPGNTFLGFYLYLINGKLGFNLGDDLPSVGVYGEVGLNVANGAWRHVAVTVKRSTSPISLKLYVDGAVVYSTATVVLSDIDNLDEMRIGGNRASDPPLFFTGAMDELAFYDRALVQSEIGYLATHGASGKCTDSNCPPFFGDQPLSLQTTQGQSASFSVTAYGAGPLNYQWRKNGVNLADDARISGAQTSVLTINPTLAADAGSYDVVVSSLTNECGSITSDRAVLTVTNCVPARITSVSFAGGNVTMTFNSQPGFIYRVEYKDTLNDPSWQIVATITASAGTTTVTDQVGTNKTRFYRVLCLQ